MIFALVVILVLMFSFFISAALRIKAIPSFLLSIYVLSSAHIVFVGEVAGTISLLNSRSFYLLSHVLLTGIAWFLWHRAGRPFLLGPFKGLGSNNFVLSDSIRNWPHLWILGLGVSAAYLIGAILILTVPPNNVDSMTGHLARVAYWLQHGSLRPWQTAVEANNFDPMNTAISVLWTILFSGSDRFAGFIQWFAVPFSIVAIFGIARLLGCGRAESLFAGLIWATFPEIILQSTTTQTHLFASAQVTISIYFLFLGVREKRKEYFLLSGLGFGLALGASQFILFAIPGLILTIIILLRHNGNKEYKQFAHWSIYCIIPVILFGSYIYVRNISYYGNPFGPSKIVAEQSGANSANRLKQISINGSRFIYQAIDLTNGLPSSDAMVKIDGIKADIASKIFSLLRIPIQSRDTVFVMSRDFDMRSRTRLHEDFSWFGPVSVLFLLPIFLYHFWSSLYNRDPYRLSLFLLALSLFIGVSGFVGGWTPHKNRYFILAVTITAPLMAFFTFRGRYLSILIKYSIVFLSLTVLAWTTVANESKPIISKVWKLDRTAKISINQARMSPIIRMVESIVPPEENLGVVFSANDWQYPFFGKSLDRKIIPIYPYENMYDTNWLSDNQINYVLVSEAGSQKVNISAELQSIVRTSGWSIYYRRDHHASTWDPNLITRLLSIDEISVLEIDPSLVGRVAAASVTPPVWGQDGTSRSMWLGNTESQGISFTLFSMMDQRISLKIDVAAGPSRTDSRRTVRLSPINNSGSVPITRSFNKEESLIFNVDLHQGMNEFNFQALDTATISILPNGDTRPLIVHLNGITAYSTTMSNNPLLSSSWEGRWSDKWIGKRAHFSVQIPRGEHEISFAADVLRYNVPSDLVVKLRKQVVKKIHFDKPGLFPFTIKVRPNKASTSIIIDFEQEMTFNPKAIGLNDDARDLGVRIDVIAASATNP